jgi:NitT/TauT family transport system permease protein
MTDTASRMQTPISAEKVRRRAPSGFGTRLSVGRAALFGVAGWALFVALWEASIFLGLSNEALLPHVTDVVRAFYMLFAERGFLYDVLASLQRIVVSFALVCAVGVPIGILMGASPRAEALFGPFVSTWRYLPAASFVPLLLMWFGAGEGQKIALLFLGSIWFLITLVADHTRSVRKELVETSLTLGGTPYQVLTTVIVPAALPNIFIAMRQMLAIGWTYLVIAEIVATTDGIGAAMMRSRRFLRVDEIIASIVMIGILGLLSDMLFRRLSWKLFPYKNRHEL